jgi:hypothetical protein
MATVLWNGGTAGVAQVRTIVFAGTWAGDNTGVTTTMTAEDGTTTQAVTTSTAGTAEAARDAHLTALQASANTLFTRVTWTSSGTDTILGTASNAGVPFTAATAEDDSTGSISSDSTTTASKGPNDWNTADNFEPSGVPTGSDDVRIMEGSYDIYYGLDQSAVGINNIYVGRNFKGAIGDIANSYYLKTGSGTELILHSYGRGIWIDGTWTNVRIKGGNRFNNMVKLAGTITNLIVGGAGVRGTVRVATGTALTNLYQLDAINATVDIEASVTGLTVIEQTTGTMFNESVVTTGTGMIKVSGDSDYTQVGPGTSSAGTIVDVLEQRGGTIHWNCGGTLGSSTSGLKQYGGLFTTVDNTESLVTIDKLVTYAGTVDERSGLANVTYTLDPDLQGGDFLPDVTRTPTVP